ncbi:MAG: Beta-barrel assembly-enhancing protease [Phycisphaerae bacterium]|nr:Beta-barrel assembly-enhancing protease [Phycisphaerae bacterium]
MSAPGIRGGRDDPGPAPPATKGGYARLLTGVWLPVLLGGVCYLTSLGNQYAYDDTSIVLENPRVRAIADVRAIWLSDWWQPQTARGRISERFRDRLYRPLTMFSFALNYAIHGMSAAAFHATNVALHMAACGLVWMLARRMLANPVSAAAAAALFAVHPVHAEAVAGLVGRAEVLAAIFLLLGLLALMPRGRPVDWRDTAAAAAAFLAAVLAKETAICFPALAGLALLYHRREDGPRGVRWWAVRGGLLLAPLLIYFPLRVAALEGHLIRDRAPSVLMNPLIDADVAGRLVTPFTILGRYTRMLLMPDQLSSDYGLRVIEASGQPEIHTLLGLAAVGGLIYACRFWRSAAPLPRVAALLALMFVASYALISNSGLLIGVIVAERLMYWPSVVACLLLAAGGELLWRAVLAPGKRYASLATAAVLFGVVYGAALGLRSTFRSLDWADDLTLFTTDAQTFPQSANLNLALANVYLRPGPTNRPAQALQLLERALRIYPRNPQALFLTGSAYHQLRRDETAIQFLERAVQFDQANSEAHELLTLLKAGGRASAESRVAELRAATTTQPASAGLRVELGRALRELGQFGEAHVEFERAAALAPDDPEVLYSYAESLALVSDPRRAVEAFRKVVALRPDDWRAHGNLATLIANEDPAASLEHAQTAHRLAPDVFENNVNLAEALALNKRSDEAIDLFTRILRGLPADDPRRPLIADRLRVLRE